MDVTYEHKFGDDVQIERADTARTQNEIDPAIDKRVTRKFDLHLIRWLFSIWLLAFIDRSNIGNAKIDGLVKDIHLDGNKFNIALVVFYVPYIAIDIPSNWVVKHFHTGHYIPSLLIGWARFFLGLCEGSLLGAIIIYLAVFYRRHQLLYRIGLFYCAAPLSGAFGGLLATGLAMINYGDYNGWPWIFFVEGIITVCFGILCFFFMPHTPSHAKFLTAKEREVALLRMKQDSHGAEGEIVDEEHFSWHWVRMAILNPNTWFCSLAWFFLLVPLYSFSLFLPTIIQALGYTSTKAQLFTVPPNLVAFCCVLLAAAFSDKLKMRGPFMPGGCLLGIIGYAMLLSAKTASVRYGGTFFVASEVYTGSPMVMGWLSNNLAPHYVRVTGIGFQIALANCAAFLAVFTYLSQDAPDYKLGHSINIGSLVLCMITIVLAILYCLWENKKRERADREVRFSEGSEVLLGHRHPHFRYTI